MTFIPDPKKGSKVPMPDYVTRDKLVQALDASHRVQTELRREIVELEETNANLNVEVYNLKEIITNLKGEVHSLEETITGLLEEDDTTAVLDDLN